MWVKCFSYIMYDISSLFSLYGIMHHWGNLVWVCLYYNWARFGFLIPYLLIVEEWQVVNFTHTGFITEGVYHLFFICENIFLWIELLCMHVVCCTYCWFPSQFPGGGGHLVFVNGYVWCSLVLKVTGWLCRSFRSMTQIRSLSVDEWPSWAQQAEMSLL